jgi:uncharacterized membrane protein
LSEILIFAYSTKVQAFAAGEALARLQKEADVAPEDIVVVVRDDADSVNVNHLIDRTTGRPLAGGDWGMVIGVLFLAKDVARAKGPGLGTTLREIGLDVAFLEAAVKALEKGGAVVGMRRRFLPLAQIEGCIRALPGKGKLIRTKLEPETEERLMDLQDQIPADVLEQAQADG